MEVIFVLLAFLFYLAVLIAVPVGFGFASRHINESKGYYGGFAWGFWLGIIGIIVVACKPDISSISSHSSQSSSKVWTCTCGRTHSSYVSSCACGVSKEAAKQIAAKQVTPGQLPQGGWRCTCGRVHADYETSCVCGVSKKSVTMPVAPAVPSEPQKEQEKIALLKEYKQLLEDGVITEEEFENKKQKLLQ